jgi:imidazolonepropionase-like amidohydrolase
MIVQRWLALTILSAFTAAFAAAADANPSGLTVIHAERAFTGHEFVENVTIVVDGGLIRSVSPTSEFTPIEGSRVVEAKGMTVAPGFIDSHVHVLGLPLEVLKNIAQYGWGRVAEEAISQVPGNREGYLQGGVTSVIDMGSTVAGMLRLKQGLESGSLIGPDLCFCGPLFTAPNGHPAGTIYRGQHDLIDNATVQVAESGPAARTVAELASQGVDFIKLVYDDGTLYGGKVPRLDLAVARTITAEAHSHGLPVIAHVGALESEFADMLECGVDGVEHCFAYNGSDTVLRDMAAHGVFFTPTLSIYEIYANQTMPRMMETVAKAREKGVTIVAGTDFPSSRFRAAGPGFYRELVLLEEAGLSRREVLEAATANGARKIGKQGETGSIVAGCRANLVFFSGDLREGALGAERVRAVMLRGRMVVEEGTVTAESRRGLGRQPIMVFPFGFYETVSGFSLGGSFLDFNTLGSGVALGLTATYSFASFFAAEIAASTPSPLPQTSLDFRLSYDGYSKRFFGLNDFTTLGSAVTYAWSDFQGSAAGSTTLVPTIKLNTAFSLDDAVIGAYDGQVLPGMTGTGGGLMTLARVEIAHDARDLAAAPWYGDYEALAGGLSHPFLGSAYSFETLDFDLRYFLSILHHHVIAARLRVSQCLGEAPFYARPEFGGLALGRGYQPDRFIGNIGAYGQLEYRFPIWSMIGGDLFVDAGQVRDEYQQFTPDGFHLCGGAGLRFAFSEQSILSVDVGFDGEPISPEGFTIIVRTGHAF